MNAGRVLRRPVPFHAGQADASGQSDLDRDLGVALCRSGEDGARIAFPLLKRAVRARPDDVFAWEALGLASGQLGRDDESLAAFGKALALEPKRESTLVGAAYQSMKMDRRQDAVGFWQRAIAQNPWRSDYHAELGLVYFNDGNWSASAAACRDALALRASWLDVRKRLVQCYLRMGNADAALAEQESVLASGRSESH
jgi:tetratricopeptide (TPR) repeat protein